MLNPGSPGCIGYILSLPDLTFKAHIGKPEVLHAEDTIGILEGLIELSPIVQVARDNLCAECFQFLGGGLVPISCQRPYLPALG